MKTFDFSHPDFYKHSPEVRAMVKENYNKTLTEEQFGVVYAAIERPRHSPSRGRGQYRYLVKKYGLFSPKAKVKGIA